MFLLVPQAVHWISRSGFDCLEAHCQERDGQCRKTGDKKYPGIEAGSEWEIPQP